MKPAKFAKLLQARDDHFDVHIGRMMAEVDQAFRLLAHLLRDEQVRALRSLDINDRVLVSGVAGSGKTRLAQWWAHQSARAGRSTLLTCYNDPLGNYLVSTSVPYPTLTVGPFLRLVSQFPGIPQLEEPEDPDERDDFWNSQMIDHLLAHADESQVKFETIVIDERQDFNDEWMEIIEKFLPQQMSEAEITEVLRKIIADLGAAGPSDIGKLMGAATKQLAGKADGKLINTLAKNLLG